MPNLKPMQFKNYVWPHNPTTYKVDFDKKVIIHDYPDFHGSESEDFGVKGRVVTGSGVFFGPNAASDFASLVRVFRDREVGKLIHPVWGAMDARFTKLSSEEEPTPNYIEYTFEFMEYTEASIIVKLQNTNPSNTPNNPAPSTPANSGKTHIVKSGDTLWGISKQYYKDGNQWPKIADANKSIIKNPNQLSIGWKLTIP